MGQKINPNGFRVAVTKNWRSRWFADKAEFGDLLHEDIRIRNMIKKRLKDAAVPDITIERYANRARITIFTARPGIVIGRKGQELERVREEIAKMTGKEIYIEIKEVKNPDVTAQLVAENIAVQLERRVSFRRAMKRAVQLAIDLGADGIRVQVSGRLGGAELSRTEQYMNGKVPLHTLRAPVQYGFTEARTMAGTIGVKVWICRQEETSEGKEQPHAAYA